MKEDQKFTELYHKLAHADQPPAEKFDRERRFILARMSEHFKEQEGEKQSSRETQDIEHSE